jgi:hypothetical protein
MMERLSYDPITGEVMRDGKPAGCLRSDGYIQISLDGKLHRAHRLAWRLFHGEWPDGEIDHINGVRSDNRIENLRVTSRVENMRNQKRHNTNTSGTAGVCWHKKAKKWVAMIKVNNKLLYLGLHADKADAISARKAAEVQHGFHSNHGR